MSVINKAFDKKPLLVVSAVFIVMVSLVGGGGLPLFGWLLTLN